jgi:predicted Zn finger-like uncharacterized protein
MKIECPNCKLTGQVSDANIPPEGRGMECPRCKTSFFVEKIAPANWADTFTDCPECGYSTFTADRFDICPTCGLVVKEYRERKNRQAPGRPANSHGEEPAVMDRERMRQELERLEREDQKRRQQRAESVAAPLLREESVPENIEVPAAVKYLGWGFVFVALGLLAYGGKGVYDYLQMTPAQAVTTRYEDPPTAFGLYLSHGLAPILMVIIGIYFMVAGSQFLRMRPWARKAMEAASWLGIVFFTGRELASLVAAFRRASTDASILYYLVEFAGFILMTACWSAPLVAAIWYLRRDLFRDLFED